MARTAELKRGALRTRNWLIGLTLIGGAALTACSDGDNSSGAKSPPPASSTPAPTEPSTSADSQHAADETAVLGAYTKSWEEQTKAYGKASSQGTALKDVTSLDALSYIESDLSSMRESGRVTQGRPVIDPKVTTLSWKKIPEATVTDCVDISGWVLIDRDSKKEVPLPTERRTKYVSIAKLEKWGTKWMVTQLTSQDRGC